jgi:micrococcal nuclease
MPKQNKIKLLEKHININTVKNLAIAVLILVAGFLVIQKPQFIQTNNNAKLHYVKRVIDGDTIVLSDNTHVRLIGINSPEKDECFYQEPKDFVTNILQGKQIILERDIESVDTYGRLLRYAFIPAQTNTQDQVFVNHQIIRLGYASALAVSPNTKYRDLLTSGQEQAIRENLGMWEACEYQDELDSRREQNNEPPTPEHVIKGNISTRGYGKTYLVPGCDNYNLVKIDLDKGEQYFKTEADAQSSGFRKATNCP